MIRIYNIYIQVKGKARENKGMYIGRYEDNQNEQGYEQ